MPKSNVVITIKKANETDQTFSSYYDACQKLGAKSGKNANASIKFIQSKGYEVYKDGIKQEPSEETTEPTKRKTLMEMILDKMLVIDQKAIDALNTEINKIILNDKVDSKQVQAKIIEISKKIKELSNPQATEEGVLNYVKNLYNEYQTSKNATTTDKPTEPTEPTETSEPSASK